jgi:hypothetical protein
VIRPPVEELTEVVTARTGRLHSAEEAAAVLESLGYTDEAAQDLRRANVFHLARDVLARQAGTEAGRWAAAAVEADLRSGAGLRHRPVPAGRRFGPTFARGLGLALPSLLMVAAFLGLSLSLWATRTASLGRAGAIGIAVVSSSLATAGFTQAIGRRGLWYLRQDVPLLALKVGLVLAALGVGVAALVGLGLWALLESAPLLPADQVSAVLVYHASLSALWLALALLYMAQRELVAAAVVAAGIGIVWLARNQAGATVLVAHQAGIVAAAVLALAFAAAALSGREASLRRARRVRYASTLPSLAVTLRAVGPYFAYGVLYFALLFSDRLLAWTGKSSTRPTLLRFHPDYEAGLVWAALGMLLAFGMLEFVVHRHGDLLRSTQHRAALTERAAVAARAGAWYREGFLWLLLAAIAGAVLAFAAGVVGVRVSPLVDRLVTPRTVLVFAVAAPSYALLLWSLMNAVLSFAMSRPAAVLRAVVPALVADLAVGLAASRLIGYWAAVYGLAAGAVVFWAVSTAGVVRALRRADYHLYSAF